MEIFHQKCGESGIVHDNEQIFQYLQSFEDKGAGRQMSLWD